MEDIDTWRPVELAVARGAPYDEVMAVIDRCAALPRAAPSDIESWRLIAALDYDQPVPVCEAALRRYIAVTPPSLSRSARVLAACAQIDELARVYLSGVIEELEQITPSDATAEILEAARRVMRELTERQS